MSTSTSTSHASSANAPYGSRTKITTGCTPASATVVSHSTSWVRASIERPSGPVKSGSVAVTWCANTAPTVAGPGAIDLTTGVPFDPRTCVWNDCVDVAPRHRPP